MKVVNGGSSIGVELPTRARSWKPPCAIFLSMATASSSRRRYTAPRSRSQFSAGAASPIEIVPPEGSTFDYVAKYQSGDEGAREICPARISEKDRQTVCEAALKFHNALGLSVYSRSDFIIDREGRAWCLEVNTLPGMTPNSLIPKAAKLEGLEYPQLCEEIIRLSLECKSKK